MKQQALIIIAAVFLLFSCGIDTKQKMTNKTKVFDFADNYLTVIRTINKINEDEYKVVIQIKSPEQLGGYVEIEDEFENPIQVIDSTQWKYEPYYSSDKEIRFVFSDPAKTIGQATPIPNYRSFQLDYIIKSKNSRDLKIRGTIMYLVKNRPVPLLTTSAEFRQ